MVPDGHKSQCSVQHRRDRRLWLTAGLGCDGDSYPITAATQPSLEDLVARGDSRRAADRAAPSGPRLRERRRFSEHLASGRPRASSTPFVLVVEGSIPNETIKAEGYWAAFGTDPSPASRSPPALDRSPGAESLGGRGDAGTCSAYGGIHAMAGNPTGCMGLPDYLGWDWKSKAGLPIVCVPGCPVQPDNFMETLLHLLNQAAGRAPMIPLDEQLRPTLAVRRRPCTRAAIAAATTSKPISPTRIRHAASASSSSAAGARWCNATSASAAGWRASAAARTSAASASAARCPAFPTNSCRSWTSRPARSFRPRPWPMYGRTVRALRRFTQASMNNEPGVATSRATEVDDGRTSNCSEAPQQCASPTDGSIDASRRSIATSPPAATKSPKLVEKSWDPITRDRRQPGHLHQDRLRRPARGRVP